MTQLVPPAPEHEGRMREQGLPDDRMIWEREQEARRRNQDEVQGLRDELEEARRLLVDRLEHVGGLQPPEQVAAVALAEIAAEREADPTPDLASALEGHHRPILGPGAAVFDVPRRFLLNRYEDPEGTTGVGAVAWGTVFPDGWVAVCWQTQYVARSWYATMEDVLHLHGHKTAVEWLDT